MKLSAKERETQRVDKRSLTSKQPILAAIDFSSHSRRALIWAGGMARLLDTSLVVLHVVHDPAGQPGYYVTVKKQKKHLRRIEEAAGEMMSDFLARIPEKHRGLLDGADSRMVTGLPVTRILEMAEKTDAQMIVVGCQGRNGLSHLLLGSKAQRVARLSRVPVMIVKDEKPGSATSLPQQMRQLGEDQAIESQLDRGG